MKTFKDRKRIKFTNYKIRLYLPNEYSTTTKVMEYKTYKNQ